MRNCTIGACPQWAQYRMARAIKGPDPKDSAKQIVIRFETLALVCRSHKKQIEDAPFEPDLRFAFVGAVPDSVNFR